MGEIDVSLIQLEARGSKRESLQSILKLIDKTRGDLILLPEYSMFDITGLEPSVVEKGSEPVDGDWVKALSGKAREKGSCIITSFFERNPKGRPYNSVAIINEKGEIVSVYRKTHLFDALGYKESSYFTPGDELFNPIELCGVKIGVAICFEIRFPEIIRYQVLKGAEIVIVPSAWYRGIGKEEQYRFLARARAHENTVWVIAPILYGSSFTGRSIIVDPLGVPVIDGGYGEKILEYTVDTGAIERARKLLPLLELRRPNLYRGIIGE